ncbi:MAG: TRIC cation channel family protein [Flavobacteriales bacterium]|nr:TRIC cation channel family protein [Flavobacteriales bacterium]
MFIQTIYLDVAATFFFAMSGALISRKYGKLDSYGIGVVALLTATGGGTVRDMLLNAHPIAWISHEAFVIAVVLGVVTARLFGGYVQKGAKILSWIDPIAVSFAALAGMHRSLDYGANPLTAVFLGVVTATFGGLLRDVICNEIPKVLSAELYASIVLMGLVINQIMTHLLTSNLYISNGVTFVFIVSMRLITLQRDLHIRDLRRIYLLRIRSVKRLMSLRFPLRRSDQL